MKRIAVVGIIMGIAALSSTAALIDFEADLPGFKPNGWSPAGHPLVKFSDTVSSNLFVGGFGVQGLGSQSLAVLYDGDGSKLQIDFLSPVNSIVLWFGNDDPGWAGPTDYAWLEVWSGATLLSTVMMLVYWDDIMNQQFGWTGTCFDRVYFWYGDADGNPFTTGPRGTGLFEIVDHIEYYWCNRVPEAGSALGLLGLAVVGLGLARRRWVAEA